MCLMNNHEIAFFILHLCICFCGGINKRSVSPLNPSGFTQAGSSATNREDASIHSVTFVYVAVSCLILIALLLLEAVSTS